MKKLLLTLTLLTACGEEIQIIQGPKGDTGAQGERGLDGANGVDGTDGVDGINGVDGKDGVDNANGKDGVDGKDGINGTNGSDAVAQVTTVSFTNTTSCKEIINESGLVVFGKKSSSNSDTVSLYFNSSCTGNNEALSYSSNETLFIGRNLIVITGRNSGNPQPLAVSRVKL
jgi:hypothetical protein